MVYKKQETKRYSDKVLGLSLVFIRATQGYSEDEFWSLAQELYSKNMTGIDIKRRHIKLNFLRNINEI